MRWRACAVSFVVAAGECGGMKTAVEAAAQKRYLRKTRKRWREEGKCISCGRPREEAARTKCLRCRAAAKLANANAYKKLKMMNTCVRCKKQAIAADSKCFCVECGKIQKNNYTRRKQQ